MSFTKSSAKKLAISLILPQLAGGIGALFTTPSVTSWYGTITKPSFNPPSWIFGPVWTTLFVLMGIAFYLVWQQGTNRPQVRQALAVFGVQLVLNTLWSIIFFGLHSPGAALIEIAFLWLAIAATIAFFAKISKPAAWLLAPYLAWVSFAAFLNFTIWRLN